VVLSIVWCCMHRLAINICTNLQVCRGTAVMLVAPVLGTEECANPFLPPDEGAEADA
jgi:hypothetical protein